MAKRYLHTGAQLLDGQAKAITIRDQQVWLLGTGVDRERRLGSALKQVPHGTFKVLLNHFPALAAEAARRDVDVMLSGDTHGGQVRLPLLGELVRVASHGVWFSAGMHRVGSMWLYVNRGLGAEGGIPRFRFNCRPEIAVLQLVAQH
jgi:uncharacterized protein